MTPTPTIPCRPVPPFAAADRAAARAAFRDAAPIPLGQAWLRDAEPGFAPAIVRTGWRGGTLLVLAELTDADIFTRAGRHNDRFWELGDTFEMFLQPQPGSAYVELHVTPNNLRLQLRFEAPLPAAPAPGADPFASSLIHEDVFQSRTWVDAAAGQWSVLAEVPAASVTGRRAARAGGAARAVEAGPSGLARSLAGAIWRCSFCRYDYTRGRAQPVLSSSSPHAEPRFHRVHEWTVLQFVA